MSDSNVVIMNDSEDPPRRCCNACYFGNVDMAKAYNWAGMARGAVIMSNFFLATALIRLASDDAGCDFFDDDEVERPECTNTIYGFRPSSLIPNIAVITGILSAFFMPIIGAVVDFTPHRRYLGITASVFIVAVQAIQIGVGAETWLAMAILQALNGFVYQILVLVCYSYLPDMSGIVGEEKMNTYTGLFNINQFGSSLSYLILVSAIGIALKMNDVSLARLGQAISVPISGILLFFTWKFLPNMPALHEREEGKSLAVSGFSQLWLTTKGIKNHYGGSVGWFFLTVVFAEAGYNAFTQVSVTFMVETLKLSGGEVGLVFVAVYIASFPGTLIGVFVTKRTNPILSWKLAIISFILFTISGALVLNGPGRSNLIYIWAALWGMGLGWHYPTENLIFSLCVPKGQEAELTGFYVYCTQILTFLPPLIFTALNESGLGMQWALMSMTIFFLIALILLQFMESWDKVIEIAKTNKMKEIHVIATVDD